MRNTIERRQALLEILCERRHEIIENLAFEFKVTRRTVETDIQILSLSYPIYTSKGTKGGVYVAEGFYIGRRYLKQSQTDLLEKLKTRLNGEELKTIESIIKSFSIPTKNGGK